MKISYNWLQKYFKDKLPSPEEVASGIIFHSFEVEEVNVMGNDTIFEIKILPDRAHDCLSHFGIAKELSVIFSKQMIVDEPTNIIVCPKSDLEIEVKDAKCRRYMGRVVKNVKVSPSPEWLRQALVSIGQKSINNIVDATNYVMFDLGNPIHAFDLDKLASHKIIVDKALNGEKLTLLDDRDVILDESILTIRDETEALVVAGVKGGKKAEVDNNTKNIMIEVANFEPVSTRKAAQKLSIFTDSAKRFENEIHPKLAEIAMDKITKLILEIGGGEVCEVVDIYNNKQEESKLINFSRDYIEKMLGIDISSTVIDDILNRFGYEYKNENGNYEVKIPLLRFDLSGPHDMAEEIGRIYGYDKITPVLPHEDFNINEDETWYNINLAKRYLASLGYKEVMTYTFVDKGEVELMASASDKNFLRTNLLDGVKKSFEMNKLNMPLLDLKELKIFEIGSIFLHDGEVMNVCFMNKKESKEMSLLEFVKTIPSDFSSGEIKNNSKNYFKMWSNYPFISRDIAVWVPVEEGKEKLKNILKENGTELLVKEPYLFDEFTKEGRTSYAYRLVFQSYEKTLTDEEVNPIMNKITEKISSLGWEVR